MIKLEHTEVLGWEHAIRGMRNPMNSWGKGDSFYGCHGDVEDYMCDNGRCDPEATCTDRSYILGSNDHDLMMRLAKGGPVHAKYRRMIAVYVDITAPLYWWKEFDTYKVGTVANSCSTMHKIHAKEFTVDDFSDDQLDDIWGYEPEVRDMAPVVEFTTYTDTVTSYVLGPSDILNLTIKMLNRCRELYLSMSEKLKRKDLTDSERKDIKAQQKCYWWQMIQLLPTSYNQKRTVMLNYEVLAGIYPSRKNHKLDEWHTFCDWIVDLPYSEIITGIKWVPYPANNEDIEKATTIEHLVDVTCSWDVEELNGEHLYEIGPGFTREDLTPYEVYLLEKSEEYRKKKKE